MHLSCALILQVVTAKVVTSAKSPGSKCFGFIVMATADEAELAITKLNNTEVQGQKITVEKVQPTDCVLLHLARHCYLELPNFLKVFFWF